MFFRRTIFRKKLFGFSFNPYQSQIHIRLCSLGSRYSLPYSEIASKRNSRTYRFLRFYKKAVKKNFAKLIGKYLCYRSTNFLKRNSVVQEISCDFRKNFRNSFFIEDDFNSIWIHSVQIDFRIKFIKVKWRTGRLASTKGFVKRFKLNKRLRLQKVIL